MTTSRDRRDFLRVSGACALAAPRLGVTTLALALGLRLALALGLGLGLGVALGLVSPMPAARAADSAPAVQDEVGSRLQPGDDPATRAAPRVAAPDPLVLRMLHLAQVGSSDTLVDLGSGDGRIAIAAARDFGAHARGIDYDANVVELARRNAEQAGVAALATFEQGDLLAADLSSATVVTMYLTPELTLRLRRALLAAQPGTRIVSREFRMGDWEPEESSKIGLRSMHLWVVPANAGGDWRLRLQQSGGAIDATMKIRQRFQMLDGRVGLAGVETTMREARVLGDQVHFAFTDTDGALRIVDARIEPGRMIGAVATRGGEVAPFLAERVGEAPPIEGASTGVDASGGAGSR